MLVDDMLAWSADGPFALVSIIDTQGSAPREAGAHMLVGERRIAGTIGGGRLEYEAVARARTMLGAPAAAIWSVALGPTLDQCCGGRVSVFAQRFGPEDRPLLTRLVAIRKAGGQPILQAKAGAPDGRAAAEGAADAAQVILLDAQGAPLASGRHHAREISDVRLRLTPRLQPLIMFGAGHVGRAVHHVLKTLPFDIGWLDCRAEDLPAGAAFCDDMPAAVADAPSGAFHLIFTQSHPLDYDIAKAVLRRGDAGYCGLIGSETKRARFVRRFREEGLTESMIGALTCPIGAAGPVGKEPSAIAIAVAVELMHLVEERGRI